MSKIFISSEEAMTKMSAFNAEVNALVLSHLNISIMIFIVRRKVYQGISKLYSLRWEKSWITSLTRVRK